jgi:hypothetical protein
LSTFFFFKKSLVRLTALIICPESMLTTSFSAFTRACLWSFDIFNKFTVDGSCIKEMINRSKVMKLYELIENLCNSAVIGTMQSHFVKPRFGYRLLPALAL